MEKIVGDYHTEIILTAGEIKTICRIGKGSECCAFLVAGARGFKCVRMSYPTNSTILSRLEEGTMNAKGRGEWDGCPWGKDDPAGP